MKTTTLDAGRRGVFPPPFEPGDTFERRVEGRDRITFVRQVPAEVPEGSLRRVKGRLLLDWEPGRRSIREAIRADREGR